MADLTTSQAAGNGGQGTTQNPQTVPSGQAISGASPRSSGVQPGTAKDVLTSQNGLLLSNSALTTVSLDGTSSGTAATTPAPAAQQPQHHVNGAFLAVAAGLVVVAMVFFWVINRSAKNTTD